MDILKKNRKLIYILLPLLAGMMFSKWILFLLPIYNIIIWPLTLGFVVYWFWVGRQFAHTKMNKCLSFLGGNSLWGISLGLYIWQFVFVDDSSRSMFWAGLSQQYELFMVPISTRIVILYGNVIEGTQVSILSYILMLFIFTLGFIYEWIKARRATFSL